MKEIEMLRNSAFSALMTLSVFVVVSSTPLQVNNGGNTQQSHYIPTLEELQRGVGTGDPTNLFKPVIKMTKGKIQEQSREEIEQYHIHYDPEMNLDGDVADSQSAYDQMVQAIAEGDEKRAAKLQTFATPFMEKIGVTVEHARKEARGVLASNGDREKRFVRPGARTTHHWDKCIIPYEYGESFDEPKRYVEDTIRKYELNTGFRFVEWNESTKSLYGLSHNNRLQFVTTTGCWSFVGNLRRDGQEVSCCWGTACVHEIGHAIGFNHEQESPIRDDFVRIEWEGINPDYWSQYRIMNKKDTELFGYYDPSSVMHYWNGAFGINYKYTMTTLDPDRDYLMARDSRYFYFFKEAMDVHDCFDIHCSGETFVCENGGYRSVVDGECTCMCPIGLDPKTLCTTTLTNAHLMDLPWPAGSFTTLNSVKGCPEGFKLGWQYHKPPNYVWGSNIYRAVPRWNYWYLEHEFCSRLDDVNDGPEWPKGHYCIYRKGGSCPSGFDTGFIQMDDAPTDRTNVTEGELPDGVYGKNTRWEFCCRSDGNDQIKLPTKNPFILFYKNGCQDIEGMVAQVNYFNWRSDTADNYHKIEGEVPYLYSFREGHYNLYFCYYSPINKECGGIFNLDSNPLDLKTMNYPNSYDTNIDCTYTIMAPENSVIQLDFRDFEVDCESEYVDIAASMPGHPGTRYCGSGIDKTIISSTNYMRLILRSTNRVENREGRLFAQLRQKSDANECITNKGKDRSYSGDINYTKNFELCLPWNEVQNCTYNRFTPETFDDDLSENYCRNTGYGTGPWCYTNAETCARDYCDACSTMNCYDLFEDCEDLISETKNFCTINLDGQALRGCRKSCDFCETVETKSTCQKPPIVDESVPSPLKEEYTVGEQVEYVCPLFGSNDVRTRTCTSSGTWTDMNFVCGACPVGWGRVDGMCYKWFPDIYLNRDDALSYCENLGATLPKTSTQKQLDYLLKIVNVETEQMQEAWMGLKEVSGKYIWDDGKDLDFLGWKTDEPNYWGDCVTIDYGGWESYVCSYERSVVCMHTPSEQFMCADQSNNCEAYIRATPDLCVRQKDFAEANCPYSCGICKRDTTIITIQRSTCVDTDNTCDEYIRATDDFCARNLEFAYTHCQSTCNMCDMPLTIENETEDFEDRWSDAEYMPEKRQPKKRAFDDCIDVPTTVDSTTTESTTSTTESTTSTTESTTSTPESTTSTTESTTSTTESTTSTPESTTSTTESTTSTTESTTSTPESTTSTTESTTSTTESTTSTTESTTSTTESTTSTSTTEDPATTTTTTQLPPVESCDPGGQPANTIILSSAENTVGQIYEYECEDGFALASGDLVRACLVTEELTGTAPLCASSSTVDIPINNVNIRRRRYTPSTGYSYTALNNDLLITRSGKLTKWRFYSLNDGDIYLQVWRFNPDVSTTRAILVGSNFVTGTEVDRIRTIEIPESEQISVQVGDVIALHLPTSNAGYIGYTRCDLKYEPTQNNQLKSVQLDPASMVNGNEYDFVMEKDYNCRTWSLNAFIREEQNET